MKVTLVGSRFFGAKVFEVLSADGAEIARVVAPAGDDRLVLAAQAAGVPVHILEDPKNVPARAIADGTGLIVAAHTHARVSQEALARSRLGGVGYHPSLLPRHRGIAAVEWTILDGDPIAGGSVYHLAETMDGGAIAAQDWCFVVKGETARELWERALAPMGLNLLARVVRYARQHGEVPAQPQDERFATQAPMIRRTVSLTEQGKSAITSLVATVTGPDRPGIVSLLSERAQGFGANWAGSRIATLAGRFAGLVHFEVPPSNVESLAAALDGLQRSGVHVAIATREQIPVPAGRRAVKLELVGHDRLGIVSELSGNLARRQISIEDLHTEIVEGATPAEHLFKVKVLLVVPESVPIEELQRALQPLTNEMTVDVALGEQAPGG